jgi:glycosyltransferase involved in cell wall biosynthesis
MAFEFTVLIPVYNTKASHLQECWQSINSQTLKPKEVIFIDDGSTNLETIRFLDSVNATVKTLDRNYGVSHALNVGHGLCSTEWVALQGSDDLSKVNRFEKQAAFIELKPNIDCLGTQIHAFYDHDPKRKSIFTSQHKAIPKAGRGWQTNHGTVMYRNSVIKEIGGYNVDLRRAQDIELFNRLMVAGKKLYNLHDTLYYWRRYLRS